MRREGREEGSKSNDLKAQQGSKEDRNFITEPATRPTQISTREESRWSTSNHLVRLIFPSVSRSIGDAGNVLCSAACSSWRRACRVLISCLRSSLTRCMSSPRPLTSALLARSRSRNSFAERLFVSRACSSSAGDISSARLRRLRRGVPSVGVNISRGGADTGLDVGDARMRSRRAWAASTVSAGARGAVPRRCSGFALRGAPPEDFVARARSAGKLRGPGFFSCFLTRTASRLGGVRSRPPSGGEQSAPTGGCGREREALAGRCRLTSLCVDVLSADMSCSANSAFALAPRSSARPGPEAPASSRRARGVSG
eukprot:m.74843 g.74843  ORF g.74843 m.74843 type:complete len:313 (+) comp7783_c0_seq4:102-1040(+)